MNLKQVSNRVFEFFESLRIAPKFTFVEGWCTNYNFLRSLDPPRVTNGIRCVIIKLSADTIEAKISPSQYAGHVTSLFFVFHLFQVTLLPFEFRRVQFPVSLYFAITVNKSQDQKAVGVDMTDESFTHGMLLCGTV